MNAMSRLLKSLILFVFCIVINLELRADSLSVELKDFNTVQEMQKTNDLTIRRPRGFVDIKLRPGELIFSSNPAYIDKAIYQPVDNSNDGSFLYMDLMQSKDKNVLFMYPAFDFELLRLEGLIQHDISYAGEDELMDVTPFIKIIDKEDGVYIGNADKAVIYEFKTSDKLLDLYDNFVGVYLRKYGHACLALKIGLTEEGLKHKDKYIKMLLSSIKYGDKILNPEDKMPTDDEFRFEPPTLLRPGAKPGYIQ